jgi:hypothetical protein
LIVCPIDEAERLYSFVKDWFSQHKLRISANKTEAFTHDGAHLVNITKSLEPTLPGSRSALQYSGLEWNGNQIVLRPGTIARRFRPKNKLAPKYWRYHSGAAHKIQQKAISGQFKQIRTTLHKKEYERHTTQDDS